MVQAKHHSQRPELQYVGLYDDLDGNNYRSVNTNILFDTDLPRLGLNFSIGVQNLWLTSRKTLRRDGIPVQYMDVNGASILIPMNVCRIHT